MGGRFFDVIGFIFFFIVVAVGAYYSTKLISKKASTLYKGKNIKVLERINFDRDKYFVLLQKDSKVYLIGVTTQGMTLIDTYSIDDISLESEINSPISFEATLRKLLKRDRAGGDKSE